jgi:hypothetical protein
VPEEDSGGGAKNAFVSQFILKLSIYQDRLRTNIGKTQQQEAFLAGEEEEGDGLTESERQHAILHHFYAKHAPKTEFEVAEIVAKRKGDAETLSEKAFEGLCSKLEEKYGENPASLYAIDRAMGMLDDDDDDSTAGDDSGGDGNGEQEDEHHHDAGEEGDSELYSEEEAAEQERKQRERQVAILHAFYAKYAPKSEEEVGAIM